MTTRVSVRKTGHPNWPWEVHCPECCDQQMHFTAMGVVAVNTRGIGNRTWEIAMLAASSHLKDHMTDEDSR